MKNLFLIFTAIMILSSCSKNNEGADAFGNFEADEIIISAESSGKISGLTINEGSDVKAGDVLAIIDTVQLSLQKQQLIASMNALGSRRQDVQVQVNVLEERKNNLLREKNRLENMYKEGAATSKQLDDINGEIQVVDKNIKATSTGMNTTNTSITNEMKPLQEQIRLIDDKIQKSIIKSPINGQVLVKYAENSEIAIMGKPLLKLAEPDKIYLKAYISGSQLSKVKLNQMVDVYFDKNEKDNEKTEGVITWVSDKAEFTPKIIQTKEERVNLVYAVKIMVKNDGKIKICMPGEVKFR